MAADCADLTEDDADEDNEDEDWDDDAGDDSEASSDNEGKRVVFAEDMPGEDGSDYSEDEESDIATSEEEVENIATGQSQSQEHVPYQLWSSRLQRKWQNEVIDRNIVFCAVSRTIEVTLIHLPLHLSLGGGHVPLMEIVLAVVETTTNLLATRKPRRFYIPFVVMQFVHFVFVYTYYWHPETFGLPGNGRKGFQLLHWAMNYVMLAPIGMPEYWLVKYFVFGYLVAFCIIPAITLCTIGAEWGDIADLAVAVVTVAGVGMMSMRQRNQIDKKQRYRFLLDIKRKKLSRSMFRIFECMVPSFVIVPMLKQPGTPYAFHCDIASVLFVKVANFDDISERMSPTRLVDYLNTVFTAMERSCNYYAVTKIETVGEEFVCAVGVKPGHKSQDKRQSHQISLGNLMETALDILSLRFKEKTMLQIGIHTGPVVAGVIGQKLPRFRLFGDTINTAARMMQKGLPGHAQFGEETFRLLPSWVSTRPRGLVEMKGKGQVMTYLLQRGRGLTAELGRSSDSCGPIESPRGLASPAGAASHLSSPGTFSPSSRMGLLQNLLLMRNVTSNRTTDQCSAATSDDAGVDFFEEAVTAMARVGSSSDPARKLQKSLMTRCCRHFHNCFSCVKLSHQEEDGFLDWFMSTYLCKHLERRMNAASVLLVVLTAGELSYVFFLYDDVDLRVYLFSRCILLLIALAVRFWISCGLDTHRSRVTLTLFNMIRCIVVTLFVISYSAVPHGSNSNDAGHRKFQLHGVSLELISPVAVGVCAKLMTTHQFLMIPAIVSAILPLVFSHLLADYVLIEVEIAMDRWFIAFAAAAVFRAYLWEVNLRKEYKARHSVTVTMERVNAILLSLMPPEVVRQLKYHPSASMSHQYSCTTVAQSDLCGFTQIASTLPPGEVVAMISELFDLFDNLAQLRNVYKVETVGDAYIAARAEKLLTSESSPWGVVLFGLDMVMATRQWSDKRGTNVNCRVGVHFGACVGGIVGTKMQRYHLFGQLMDSLEVLESTAPEGRVQISTACKEALETERSSDAGSLSLELRPEPVLLTSKGVAHEYSKVGGPTYLLSDSDL